MEKFYAMALVMLYQTPVDILRTNKHKLQVIYEIRTTCTYAQSKTSQVRNEIALSKTMTLLIIPINNGCLRLIMLLVKTGYACTKKPEICMNLCTKNRRNMDEFMHFYIIINVHYQVKNFLIKTIFQKKFTNVTKSISQG